MQTTIHAKHDHSALPNAGLFCLALMIALLAQPGRADPLAAPLNITTSGLGAALGIRIDLIDSDLYFDKQIFSIRGHQNAPGDPLLAPRVDPMSALTANVFQNGQNNRVSLHMQGYDNLVTIQQAGTGNRVDAAISGHGNQAITAQSGRLNSAQFTQSGVMNSISIQQGTW